MTPIIFHQASFSATQVGQGLAAAALIGTAARLLSGVLLDRGLCCSWPVRAAAVLAFMADLVLLQAKGFGGYLTGQLLIGLAAGLYFPAIELAVPLSCAGFKSSRGYALARSADALGVACRLRENPQLIPGGGATYIALARRLRRYAETVPGREQLAIEAFADGLETIPRVLAENAGMDPIDTLLEIVAIQTKEEDDTIGLNVVSRQPENMRTSNVVEPSRVLEQAISGASEATIAVLRIDDVLWAKQEIGVPDDVQAKLDGTAPDRR